MTYIARYFNEQKKRIVKLKFEGVDGIYFDEAKAGGDTWNPMVEIGNSIIVRYKDKILSIELNKFDGAKLVVRFQGPHDFYVSRMTLEERDEAKKRKILSEEV